MSEFSVGDRVVVTSDESTVMGQRGVISELDDFGVKLILDGGEYWWTDIFFLTLESEYEVLSAPPLSVETEVAKRPDVVNHPSHYTSHPSGIECKDIVGHYPFFVGSAIKYLWRAGLKTEDAVTDLRKAIQNIEFEIERLENS
ncbi:DUF3310 domain-containing protein [Streptomyces sp. NBC_01197]|uniref:DUF3310 domain-containing protein n=1 Tax=Streptomyces sp. NBC_01197 TaxID=2903768 RepID=UPI002E0D9BB6|nr:DUF3310 domain-containing protein [Streptomyces sp. NBC_01197]